MCRCVVLVAPHGPLPRPLLRGLEQRGAVAIAATDAPAALVDLAYSRAGALIVQDPDAHEMLGDLLDAVHRYFPRTTCWRYDTGAPDSGGAAALSRLNGYVSSSPLASSASSSQAAPPARTDVDTKPCSPRVNRDEIEHRLNPLLVRVPQSIDPANEPLISEEELAMLLGPIPGGRDEGAETNGNGGKGDNHP